MSEQEEKVCLGYQEGRCSLTVTEGRQSVGIEAGSWMDEVPERVDLSF